MHHRNIHLRYPGRNNFDENPLLYFFSNMNLLSRNPSCWRSYRGCQAVVDGMIADVMSHAQRHTMKKFQRSGLL